MADAFTFRINTTEVRAALARWQVKLEPGLLAVAGQVMKSSIEQTFRDQGSPAGSWPPLALRTLGGGIRSKAFAKALRQSLKGGGAGRKILIQSGRLKNSITSHVEGNRLIIGTNLVYARIHQMGGMAGRGRKTRIPARPFLVFRPEDPERMQKAMDAAMLQIAKAEGL